MMQPALTRSTISVIALIVVVVGHFGCVDIPDRPDDRAGDAANRSPDGAPIFPTPDTSTGDTSRTPVSTPDNIPSEERPPTLSVIHQELFEPECASCHIDREPPSAGFSLRLDDELLSRLRAPSNQLQSMPRVTPTDVESSYLWHKLSGTHVDVGGVGSRCPIDSPPVDDARMERLRTWITNAADD